MALDFSDFDPLGNGSYTAQTNDLVTSVPGGGFVLDLLDGAGSSPAASTPTPRAPTPPSTTAAKLLASPLVIIGGVVLLVVLLGGSLFGRK